MDSGDPTQFVIERFVIQGEFRLEVHFRDGKVQTIDFSELTPKGWLKNLRDLDYFNKVFLNECGFLEWPNGEDFHPEHLYFWEKYREAYKAD